MDTTYAAPAKSRITIDGPWFKDRYGRTLILRGINLGGSSKVPAVPDGATHRREGFFDHRAVSFVGRPFPLSEADDHFARLKRWGFTFLRFLVTWEAIEHAGPGEYDELYLDYIEKIIKRAEKHDISLFIDPHQDVWSRFSGGDGAPGWTLEAVGMDMTHFDEAGAAVVHATHKGEYPQMIWPVNYALLASATMFTLFFAGNDFAKSRKIDGVPVQDYLQSHYINALTELASRLKSHRNVVGYGTMNEPSPGFIGLPDISESTWPFKVGPVPSPLQAMALGAGIPQDVPVWTVGPLGFRARETARINPQGVSIWQDGVECIWRENGVWNIDGSGTPYSQRPDYFSQVGPKSVSFGDDYLRPFFMKMAEALHTAHPKAVLFCEAPPNGQLPVWAPTNGMRVVNATHWYDVTTLFLKRFLGFATLDIQTGKPVLGYGAVRKLFTRQLGQIKQASADRLGCAPTLIGEFGIPFDMNNGRSYHTGSFSSQVRALDTSFRAIEAHMLSATLWNYTADNTNAHGDKWNGEDLSIFSRDQDNSGGRALEAAVRPYPRATAGEPGTFTYDWRSGTCVFTFTHDQAVTAPTDIYVPNIHYPGGYFVEVSDGTYLRDIEKQTLLYFHTDERENHRIRIIRADE